MKVWVLRLGHRLHRDERISTHCGLVARAFGADGIIYTGERDVSVINSVKKVVDKWGGPFEVKYEKNWKNVIKNWKGYVILLTMYGVNLSHIINKIREISEKKDLLVIVGSQKLSGDVYELSNLNVAIGNTPHSEVSSLAIFLHELFEGKELNKKFKNAKISITPSPNIKIVKKLNS